MKKEPQQNTMPIPTLFLLLFLGVTLSGCPKELVRVAFRTRTRGSLKQETFPYATGHQPGGGDADRAPNLKRKVV